MCTNDDNIKKRIDKYSIYLLVSFYVFYTLTSYV